jgi:hypothetical protein
MTVLFCMYVYMSGPNPLENSLVVMGKLLTRLGKS